MNKETSFNWTVIFHTGCTERIMWGNYNVLDIRAGQRQITIFNKGDVVLQWKLLNEQVIALRYLGGALEVFANGKIHREYAAIELAGDNLEIAGDINTTACFDVALAEKEVSKVVEALYVVFSVYH